MRATFDFEMPESQPSAFTWSSTLRVEGPVVNVLDEAIRWHELSEEEVMFERIGRGGASVSAII
jgi:hypothetical protein